MRQGVEGEEGSCVRCMVDMETVLLYKSVQYRNFKRQYDRVQRYVENTSNVCYFIINYAFQVNYSLSLPTKIDSVKLKIEAVMSSKKLSKLTVTQTNFSATSRPAET